MNNYHRHSCYSNIFTPDSAANNEEYAKRAVELGHKIISSVEHGWQGYYFETFELAKKYNLKCVIGAEAYWVKDRHESDKTNNHIVILAKNNKGREALNDILSEGNISGYYYKPRIDTELLLSLPADDVFITSACIAFNGYGNNDSDEIIKQLHNHFKNNFMLEVQYHHTDKQKEWNSHLLELHNQYGIELIVGLDSHYILPEDSTKRDIILEAKKVSYDDEDGWFMDYPDDKTVFNRFKEQGVLSDADIKKAMDNTDICLTFDDYDNVPIFTKDIKLPTLYPNESKEQKNKRYSKLISEKFKEYMKNIPSEEYNRYFEGVKGEVQTYKDTGMCDYPLLDYAIVKDAVEHGGLITDSGRGSAVGFFTNTLCGFSKVDRFTSAIKLYPERFISTTRIIESKSIPDIDINVGTVSIFEDAQKRVLGEEHVAPMIAFGTLKKKSSFKLYARAKDLDFDIATEISNQLDKYDEAVKYAEEDDKDEINIYDYIDEKYKDYIEQSEQYWGIVSDKKKAPSAYLLYQGNVRKEIGLIKCKSEATKKEYITCVIDGAIAENYKFLKNDILKVDVVLLIDKVFKRIGIEHFDVNTLLKYIESDQKVWDIYANGWTIGINQVEQQGSRHKCMNYKPSNISELSAFVAAIRPGFKSMYDRFERREDFSWGIPVLDNMLRTEQLPVSYIFFQEQVMSVLNYGGFPMDECYGIIKAIAKKHPEKVLPLKQKFIDGFRDKLINEEGLSEKEAQENAEKVWVIINDNCGYSFNSAHAYCMALDSSYQAWQKANYPYEFYETLLNHYSDKGNKDKVAELKSEMKKAFGISVGHYRFREDNRHFCADKEHHCIIPSLVAIKGMNDTLANELYELRNNQYSSFIDLLCDLKDTSVNSRQLDILIKLDFFSEFGDIKELLGQVEIFNSLFEKKQIKKDKLGNYPEWIFDKFCIATNTLYKITDWKQLANKIIEHTKFPKTTLYNKMMYEIECLGTIQTTINTKPNYYMVMDIKDGWIALHCLATGEEKRIKCRKKTLQSEPISKFDVIKVIEIANDKKWRKTESGEWYQIDETEEILKKYKKYN